jgi:hypothetical protein
MQTHEMQLSADQIVEETLAKACKITARAASAFNDQRHP